MRRVAVGGLALLLLATGYLLYRGTPTDRARATSGGEPHTPDSVAPLTGSDRDHANGGQADTGIRLSGNVVDERGLALTEQRGTLRFRIDGTEEVETAIGGAGGEWQAQAPKGATLTVEEIVFGDRKAVAVPATIPWPEDGSVSVKCRWLVPTLLRVVGENGEALDEVEYRECSSRMFSADEATTRTSSPIELAGAEGDHTYAVRARDHAWKEITVSVGFGGERVVSLVRAGILDVRLAPYDAEAGIQIRVSSEDADSRRTADETGRATIDSLPPGDYEIHVEVGSWRDPVVIGEATARVDAGATTRLSLTVAKPPAAPRLVPLAGVIVVAPGWTEEDEAPGSCMTPAIRAVDLSGVEVDVEPKEDGRWSTAGVAPGRYCFRLDAWTWFQVVDVGAGGSAEVRLEVPPPCDVEVHLTDRETGKPIATREEVRWCVKAADVAPDFLDDLWERRQQERAEPGIYRFRAPIGTLVVDMWTDTLRADDVEVELRSGLNRVTLKADWVFTAAVALKDGEMTVPAERRFAESIEATALDGDGELFWCTEGSPCEVTVTKAGRYRIFFPTPIEGYQPIAPVEVEFAAGKIPRIEIALKRR